MLWALFPVSYLVSASLNPLGNVVTSTLIPQTFSLDNYTKLLDNYPFTDLGAQQPDRVRVRGLRAAALQRPRGLRVLPVPVHRAAGADCSRCC